MHRDNRSLRFETQSFPELQKGKLPKVRYMPLVYAGVFLAAWIYAMSLFNG
ncbi:MAG: hypothetical protein JXR76_28230 [Deltaproteobacteria bacterium]|nr:hypothetical protein [Deltaproteobacteria bacterium]